MAIEIKAPTYPESVQEGSLATWHKQVGDSVNRDDLIVDIETDKVVLEVVAPASGTISEILKVEGDTVVSNEVIARIEEGAAAPAPAQTSSAKPEPAEPTPSGGLINPAAKKLAEERGIDISLITGTGKGGRITKEDVVNYTPSAATAPAPSSPQPAPTAEAELEAGDRVERRVPMTRMRSRIAERLLEVTQTTASLTTFNEVDMTALMDLRKQYKEEFTKMHNGNPSWLYGLSLSKLRLKR